MLRNILTRAAVEIDRVAGAAMIGRGQRGGPRSPEALGHDARMSVLAEMRGVYDRPEHFTDPASFFPAPAAADLRLTRVRAIPEGEVLDAFWPSAFAPYCDAVTERYLGGPSGAPNRTAAARLFLHADRPRPVAVLIHGYRFGRWAVEERVWPIRWLFERGLDVALPVLPFHAVRAPAQRKPLFPSSDPRITNEGFRQAVLDMRALGLALRARGAPAVGFMGMSLGGYTTSLLATVLDDLAFAVPIIPLASIADMARRSDRFVGTDAQKRMQFEALDAVHRVVSPFARPSRLAPDRVLVVAAASDQITPIDQAERLAAHFGAPLETMHGGHLLQLGRAQGFRAIGRMLGRLGLFGERR